MAILDWKASTQNGVSLPDLSSKPFSVGAEVKSKATQKASPRSSKRISKLSQLPNLPDFEKQQQSTAIGQQNYKPFKASGISDINADPLMPGKTPRQASVDPFKDMIPNFLARQIRTPSNKSVPVNFSQQNIPPVRLTPGLLYFQWEIGDGMQFFIIECAIHRCSLRVIVISGAMKTVSLTQETHSNSIPRIEYSLWNMMRSNDCVDMLVWCLSEAPSFCLVFR